MPGAFKPPAPQSACAVYVRTRPQRGLAGVFAFVCREDASYPRMSVGYESRIYRPSISQMGHLRRSHVDGMSAIAPIATELLREGNGRKGHFQTHAPQQNALSLASNRESLIEIAPRQLQCSAKSTSRGNRRCRAASAVEGEALPGSFADLEPKADHLSSMKIGDLRLPVVNRRHQRGAVGGV